MSKYTKEEHSRAEELTRAWFNSIPLDMFEAANHHLNEVMVGELVVPPSDDILLEEFLESDSSIDCVEEVFLSYYDDQENIDELLAANPQFETVEDMAKNTSKEYRYSFITDNDLEDAVLNSKDFDYWKEGRLGEHYPMWGTLFSTNANIDVDVLWQNGLGLIDSEWGNMIFVTGCGYDFYEAHWIPLFKQLKWII